MIVGVPKEIKLDEHRVGLTPDSVREFASQGHEVLVQADAGDGIGASDDTYRAAGARIVDTAEEVFASADMIVKVKEPQPVEWVQLRAGQILFTYLHLASDQAQAAGLMASGVTAIAYETVEDGAGRLPLLAPMSEVAGRLSIQAAARSLERHMSGAGLLLGGVAGVRPARVVIVGGGVVGTQAARMATGLGAEVTILDSSVQRLRELDAMFRGRVRTLYAITSAIEAEVAEADAVIGAVLVPGATAPHVLSRAQLPLLRPGSVLVDVAIDQGGCFETSHATTHRDPVYSVDGILHYCVANMPGAVPRTSTYALNNAVLPYALRIAGLGLNALRDDPGLMAGLNVHAGRLTHGPVARSLDLGLAEDPAQLLAA